MCLCTQVLAVAAAAILDKQLYQYPNNSPTHSQCTGAVGGGGGTQYKIFKKKTLTYLTGYNRHDYIHHQ